MLPCAEPPRCQARGRQHPGANSEGHRATAAARPAGRRRRPALPGREPPKKFLASLAARTRIRTRPHIHRRGRPPRPPCLGIEKRTHPTELPTPGERSAGRAQHASHRILSQRRAPAPPRGAEPTRGKRFCGEPGGGEPHATSPRNDPTHPDSRNHSSHIVYSATLRGARIQMAKIFLPTPHSRSPAALSPGVPESRLPTPDSRAHSRSPAALTPGVPTPARTPGRTPGVPTPARTPGVPTPDSRADSRGPDSRADSRGPDSRLPRGLPGSRLPTPDSRADSRGPDSRLPRGLPTPDSRP